MACQYDTYLLVVVRSLIKASGHGVDHGHWRIEEGGDQGSLAPTPPKIGCGVVNSRSQTNKV